MLVDLQVGVVAAIYIKRGPEGISIILLNFLQESLCQSDRTESQADLVLV